MRLIAFAVAAVIAGVLPAQAAWKEFVYPDLGVAKYFPVEPKMEKRHLWRWHPPAAVEDRPRYDPDGRRTMALRTRLTVVDFKGRETEGSNIMGEAISWLGTKGEVVSYGFPRLDLGKNSVYGLVLVVDEKGGNHMTSGVFFNKGKLYLMQAIVPQNSPGKGDPRHRPFHGNESAFISKATGMRTVMTSRSATTIRATATPEDGRRPSALPPSRTELSQLLNAYRSKLGQVF